MKILYICTHNRCRSILSEAIANHMGEGLIQARSAGSQPAGQVHPGSIKHLQLAGISTAGLKSQSWDEFEQFEPDLVITVCDSAAQEACPLWFGSARKAHWGLADPSKCTGSAEETHQAFERCIALVKHRVLELTGWIREQRTPEEIAKQITAHAQRH